MLGIEAAAQRDQLARMVSQMPTPVALLTGPDHLYVAASESYLRIAGKPVMGRSYREAFPELAGQGYFEMMDRVFTSGEAWSARGAPAAWDEDEDGSPEAHFIDVTFAPVRDASGAVEAITLTVEVVDERVAVERERESAVAAAEAAREHLVRVIAQAPVAMYIARDREHVFEVANQPWYAMAGKRPDEVIGRPVREVFPEFDEQGLIGVLENVYDTGQPFATEALPLTFDADGDGVPEDHFFNVVYQPLRGPAGDVYAIAAVATEVTELVRAQRSAEVARAESDATAEWSRRLLEVAAALNEAVTIEGVAEVCVRRGMEALGATAGSLGVLLEDDEEFEIVYSTGYAREVEERWIRFPLRPGKPLSDAVLRREPVLLGTAEEWDREYPAAAEDLRGAGAVAFAATPLIVANRVLAGLAFSFGAARSFGPGERLFLATLGEQAAQALERARLFESERAARSTAERLQGLTAALSGAITTGQVGDAAMQNGVRALHADAGVLALVSASGDELHVAASTGYPEEDCMGPGRVWKMDATIPIAEAARTGEPVCIGSTEEWRSRYPGGYVPTNSQSAAWAAVPVELGGRSAGALLWTYNSPRTFGAEDVALMQTLARICSQALERVLLLETEQRARAEAEAANRSKTEFLSAMSHELRTPLNAIAGYVDLLDAGVRGPITEAQRADLVRIKRAQEMLLSLINDVLNFARLEAGRLEIERVAVPVGAVLGELDDLMSNQVSARGLAFGCEPGPPDLAVLGDGERIRQILLNLLSNAIKFTESGGSIEVSAELTGNTVSIHVRDTGAGIPADRLDNIFEPFVQIDRRKIDQSQQGVGLGLAISRELARGMEGDLTVESRVGEGSTFTLSLRRAG